MTGNCNYNNPPSCPIQSVIGFIIDIVVAYSLPFLSVPVFLSHPRTYCRRGRLISPKNRLWTRSSYLTQEQIMDPVFDGFGDLQLFRLVRFVLQIDSQKNVGSHRQDEVVAANPEMGYRVRRLELDSLFTEQRLWDNKKIHALGLTLQPALHNNALHNAYWTD